MEKDNELKGIGNSLDFGARMYDSRLGRWLSVDPFRAKYPALSPYSFAANSPIIFIDHAGETIRLYSKRGTEGGQRVLIATISEGSVCYETKDMALRQQLHYYTYSKEYLKMTSFDELEASKTTFDITLIEAESIHDIGYSPNNPKIAVDGKTGETVPVFKAQYGGDTEWDPEYGGIDEQGNIHSPALMLGHETLHMRNANADLKDFINHRKTYLQVEEGFGTKIETGENVYNAEELRVIEEMNEVSKKT